MRKYDDGDRNADGKHDDAEHGWVVYGNDNDDDGFNFDSHGGRRFWYSNHAVALADVNSASAETVQWSNGRGIQPVA